MRILGIDPGLRTTGFGVIETDGPRLAYIASGTIKTDAVDAGQLPLRLKVIFENADGFEIARQDLHLRGPGEFLGSRQSGVPLLRYADLEADAGLLDAARDTAERLLKDFPEAADRHVERWLGGRKELLKV